MNQLKLVELGRLIPFFELINAKAFKQVIFLYMDQLLFQFESFLLSTPD